MHRVKFRLGDKDRDGAVPKRERKDCRRPAARSVGLRQTERLWKRRTCYDRSSRGVVGKASQRGRTQDPLYRLRL